MVELLTTSRFPPRDKDEHGKDVTAAEQYQEKVKLYQVQLKKDQLARYTLLSYMHDDLLGEFERCSTAKDMWDHFFLILITVKW